MERAAVGIRQPGHARKEIIHEVDLDHVLSKHEGYTASIAELRCCLYGSYCLPDTDHLLRLFTKRWRSNEGWHAAQAFRCSSCEVPTCIFRDTAARAKAMYDASPNADKAKDSSQPELPITKRIFCNLAGVLTPQGTHSATACHSNPFARKKDGDLNLYTVSPKI